MKTAPPNKQGFWPRSMPAHEDYLCACDKARDAEHLHRMDSKQVAAAREALKVANAAYNAAVRADESERLESDVRVLKRPPRVKCPCGSWIDPSADGPRCLSCNRKLQDVVAR